jgi:fluoride exporter
VEFWSKIAALSIGGILGVNSRYWLGAWIGKWASPQFPWATFTINVSGSFAVGFLTVALAHWLPHPNVRLMVITGFLGGYTTFSTFEFESATLWNRGETSMVLANMFGSLGAGFGAVVLGITLVQSMTVSVPHRTSRADSEMRAAVSKSSDAAPAQRATELEDPEGVR